MKLVVLESPFAGNVRRNLAYAKLCLKDCLLRGEAPIASHLLFTQPGILDDDKPEERKLGIEAGLAWTEVADLQVFYDDFGMSKGMMGAIKHAQEIGAPTEFRKLNPAMVAKLKRDYPD